MCVVQLCVCVGVMILKGEGTGRLWSTTLTKLCISFFARMCHWCNKPRPPAELHLEMPLSMVYALHFPLPKQGTVRNRVHMGRQAHSSSITLTSTAPRMSASVRPPLMRKTAPTDQFIGFRDIELPSSPYHLIGVWELTYYWTWMAVT